MNTATQPFVILLVEDEDTDAYLIKWALEKNRISVDLRQVFDGYEALEFLRRLGLRFRDAPRPDFPHAAHGRDGMPRRHQAGTGPV